jgi:hypothetical protein
MSDSTPGAQVRTLASTGESVERHHIFALSCPVPQYLHHFILGSEGQTFWGTGQGNKPAKAID